MATTPKTAFSPFLVATSITVPAYTAPLSTKSVIKHMSYHNNSSNVVTLRIYIVQTNSAPGDENTIFNKKVAPLDSKPVFSALNYTLEAGDMVYAVADESQAVALHCSVTEVV